jgi:hypothetical protein
VQIGSLNKRDVREQLEGLCEEGGGGDRFINRRGRHMQTMTAGYFTTP